MSDTVAETAQPLEGTPPVTIAIINYNGGPFLRELLDSLASQTFRRFQCLLIDNGSRDGSPALAQSIAPWVEILPAGANLDSRVPATWPPGTADHPIWCS